MMNFEDITSASNNKQSKSHILFVVGLAISFVIAYYPVLTELINKWSTSDNSSHGFFIAPICLYIIWNNKKQLTSVAVRPSNLGGLLIIFSLCIYFLAFYAGVQTLCSLTIVSLWAGIIMYVYGWNMVRMLSFPLFLLFFMIPVPSQIYASLTIPLQLIVTEISVKCVSTLNMVVFSEGNVIQLPGKTFAVIEACSGLRSLVSLLFLSLVFGYFTLLSNTLRSILFVSAVPVAIVVNIIRVMVMLIAFYYFNYDLTTGNIHTLFGLIIFMIALGVIVVEKKILGVWDRTAN